MDGATMILWRDRFAHVPWRALIGYTLYAVAAFVAFLLWAFPYERLQGIVVSELERRTGSTIAVQSARFLFPSGLAWQDVSIRSPRWQDRTLDLDAVRVRVALLALVRRVVEADVSWEGYGGKARGTWVFTPDVDGARSSLDQFGQGFDLARLPFVPSGGWQGVARIELACRWTGDAWFLGEGTGSVEVTKFRVAELMVQGVPIRGLEFETISGRAAMKGGTLTLQDLIARGPLGTAKGEGTILVRAPWTESMVNLTFSLSPTPEGVSRIPLLALAGTKQPVIIQFSGRLGKPNASLNGTPVT